MSLLKVVLADRHPVVLAGLAAQLANRDDVEIAGSARQPRELLDLLTKTGAGLLIMDLSMPQSRDKDGMALLRRIRQDNESLPIVVHTALENAGLLRSMLKVGARALVDKTSDLNDVHRAIDAVKSRRTFISASFRTLLAQHDLGGRQPLTPRQAEVFRLLVQGQSVSAVARQVSRSRATISEQKMLALRKLGLRDDRDMFIYGREHGMT